MLSSSRNGSSSNFCLQFHLEEKLLWTTAAIILVSQFGRQIASLAYLSLASSHISFMEENNAPVSFPIPRKDVLLIIKQSKMPRNYAL